MSFCVLLTGFVSIVWEMQVSGQGAALHGGQLSCAENNELPGWVAGPLFPELCYQQHVCVGKKRHYLCFQLLVLWGMVGSNGINMDE